jgi:6-phosphogluconolactonase
VTEPDIIICPDAAELNRRAAELFIQRAGEAATRSGRFAVALSGGSTPKALYSLLATPGFADRIPWPKVNLFWGDERCVPPEHPESNYRTVRESLLTKISIPSENIHRMAGEKEPGVAATEYENELKTFFQFLQSAPPRFDLILLGLGEDGHMASLFPGSEALKETKRLVVANFVDKLNAHRLTLTLPVLNESAQIVFLVAGKSKANIVKELLVTRPTIAKFPAQRIQPVDGALTWFITRDAAAELQTR